MHACLTKWICDWAFSFLSLIHSTVCTPSLLKKQMEPEEPLCVQIRWRERALGSSNIALRCQKRSCFAKQRDPELECSCLQGTICPHLVQITHKKHGRLKLKGQREWGYQLCSNSGKEKKGKENNPVSYVQRGWQSGHSHINNLALLPNIDCSPHYINTTSTLINSSAPYIQPQALQKHLTA